MSAFDNFMAAVFPGVVQRRQQAALEQLRGQIAGALEPFGPQQTPFPAGQGAAMGGAGIATPNPLGALQDVGAMGVLGNIETPGLFTKPQISSLAQILTTPGLQQFGGKMLESMLPQPKQPKNQVVEIPTGALADDNKTPLVQKHIVDLNSGQMYPIGPPAPRGSGTTVNINDTKPLSVADLLKIRLPSGERPPLGSTSKDVQAMGGKVEEKITPEQAGKQQAFADAIRDVQTLRGMIVKDDGSIDRTLIFNMATRTPFTEGRKADSLLRGAISAKVKAETGATANEEEIADMAKRFEVSNLDSDATIVDKLNRLDQFMSQSLLLTNPELYNKLAKPTTGQQIKILNRRPK